MEYLITFDDTQMMAKLQIDQLDENKEFKFSESHKGFSLTDNQILVEILENILKQGLTIFSINLYSDTTKDNLVANFEKVLNTTINETSTDLIMQHMRLLEKAYSIGIEQITFKYGELKVQLLNTMVLFINSKDEIPKGLQTILTDVALTNEVSGLRM